MSLFDFLADWDRQTIRFWVGLAIGLVSLLSLFRKYWKAFAIPSSDDIDPALIKRYSQSQTYHVPSTGFTYKSIRTVYRKHPQADKFPREAGPLPLLVFIHGLGGCVAQFGPLLTSLTNVTSCLCIDLPGCGKSEFSPCDWSAYSTRSLVQLLAVVIESYRDLDNGQDVVFIAHSMGCSLAALLGSPTTSDVGTISRHTRGLIAMCPRAEPLPKEQQHSTERLLRIPSVIFDQMRKWDRRGGPNSRSVHRMVGAEADLETKTMQLRFNEQSRTPVWRRMTYGLLVEETSTGLSGSGLPGKETWESLTMPIFLIAGQSDHVTPPEEIHDIASFLEEATGARGNTIKKTILPKPAAHALPYSPATARTVSGLIQEFLSSHIDYRLSLAWQLTYLSDSGKWDVKNLAKWRRTPATSDGPIANTFLAMKTMRQVDDVHSPKVFVEQWVGRVKAVVDISHESPAYDPRALKEGGTEYHKFPSVSKMPPTEEEVKKFEKLVDELRVNVDVTSKLSVAEPTIVAVHCHYGYNRTGFFIICYLVDRLSWRLQDAIDEFSRRRPPGIKHDYFLDALSVRYCVGIR